MGRLIQALVIFIYSVSSCGVVWSLDKIITSILMLIGGFCLFFGLFMIYAAISFFTLEGLEFMNIFTDGGRELAQYPLNIYKDWVLKLFTFFVPLAFVNYYPFLYIIGRSKGIFNMFSPVIAVLFLVPSYIFWRFGVKHYKSTGS